MRPAPQASPPELPGRPVWPQAPQALEKAQGAWSKKIRVRPTLQQLWVALAELWGVQLWCSQLPCPLRLGIRGVRLPLLPPAGFQALPRPSGQARAALQRLSLAYLEEAIWVRLPWGSELLAAMDGLHVTGDYKHTPRATVNVSSFLVVPPHIVSPLWG